MDVRQQPIVHVALPGTIASMGVITGALILVLLVAGTWRVLADPQPAFSFDFTDGEQRVCQQ
jgi:hypothetical protein